MKWNKLEPEIRNLPSLSLFKKSLTQLYRPNPKPVFNLHNPYGIKLLSRLRLGLSHLNEHLSRHKFLGVDPFCKCQTNSKENTVHFILQCPTQAVHRGVLFNNLHNRGLSIIPFCDSYLTNLLLYGCSNFEKSVNKDILQAVIDFIIQSNRFAGPLF